jgi:hypothetical protein
MADLLTTNDLPDGFMYPPQFVRVVELGLTNIEPWWILDGDRLRKRFTGLQRRYPDRSLVPFAIRQDNDDVACWDTHAASLVIVHDFASPGWEQRSDPDKFGDFYDWFRQAIEDFIDFDS